MALNIRVQCNGVSTPVAVYTVNPPTTQRIESSEVSYQADPGNTGNILMVPRAFQNIANPAAGVSAPNSGGISLAPGVIWKFGTGGVQHAPSAYVVYGAVGNYLTCIVH